MSETESLPATIQSAPAIDHSSGIKCPHCGQAFSNAGINIAIFLYGIFFLVGKESGYFGITCPRCLNSISHRNKKEAILALKQVLTGMVDFGGSVFDPKLRYYSSLSGSPTDIPLIGSFDILYLNLELAGNEPVNIEEKIMAYLEANPELKENYFCSYIQDVNYPSGTFSNIWWISSRVNNKDENAIEKLIQLENIKGIKIFPRYYHHCALIEDVDRFCWKHGYLTIHMDNLKNHIIKQHEDIEQKLILEGIDFKDVTDQNPDIADPDLIEFLQDKSQAHNSSEILNVAGDFLKIILADPYPWGIEGSIGTLCKGFWKTKHPFRSIALPISLTKFSPHPFQEAAESLWCQQAKSDILPEITKSYVQTYLMENYASFIREYAEIIHNRSFCYADLWILKEKYLKELHLLVQKQTQSQIENRFYRDDAYWIVSFNNDEKRYGDLKGFSYIHHLIKNIGIKISYFNLDDLFHDEPPKSEDEITPVSDEDLSEGYSFAKKRQSLIDHEGLQRIRNAKNILTKMMDDAKLKGNRDKYIKLKDEYSKVEKATGSYFIKGGEIRSFDDPTEAKRAKDKIDRDIKYALNKIKNSDEIAFNHFKKSIRREEGEIGYDPDKMIDWYTG